MGSSSYLAFPISHQCFDCLPRGEGLFGEVVHLCVEFLVGKLLLAERFALSDVFICKQSDVLFSDGKFILHLAQFAQRVALLFSRSEMMLSSLTNFHLQLLLQSQQCYQFLFDYQGCLLHLTHLHTVLPCCAFLLADLSSQLSHYTPQFLSFSFFLLSLKPDSFKFCSQLFLLACQSSNIGTQLLNHDFIAIPLFLETVQLVFPLHQMLISELYSLSFRTIFPCKTSLYLFKQSVLCLQTSQLLFKYLTIFLHSSRIIGCSFDFSFELLYLLVFSLLTGCILMTAFQHF